jgi:hypothetical protein
MQLTSMVEEAVREVVDAVMNARTYAERFKKECNIDISVAAIAFDLAVVPDAKGQTVELADAAHLKGGEAAGNRIRFDVKVDMHSYDSHR